MVPLQHVPAGGDVSGGALLLLPAEGGWHGSKEHGPIAGKGARTVQEPHPDVAYKQVGKKQPQRRLRPNRATPWPPHPPTARANAPHLVYPLQVAPAPVVWARPTQPR